MIDRREKIEPAKLAQRLEFSAFAFIATSCGICFLLGKFSFGLIVTIAVVIITGAAYWIFGTLSKKTLIWKESNEDNTESLYTSEGESVEWLNFMMEKIWRSIDQDFFTAIQSMIEDNIQSLAPSFIKAISIYDLDIGSQAPRIQSIRVFPPLPGRSEESIFGEVSFSFHQHPAASFSQERGRIEPTPPGVSIGIQAASGPPISVRGELTALFGKMRFKLLTGPDLPFVSKLIVAFTTPPTVETAVMPLSNQFNIMHIPTLKMLVNQGIRMGMADLVDPKSMTIDVLELMGGSANDTLALGVVCVEIRGAECDPSIVRVKEIEDSYATLWLSNQPKRTMSTTRVLTNDKDPRWNERLFVLINRDDISADGNVDIRVWDADKVKYDDMWGAFSIPAREIVQSKMDQLGNVTGWCQQEHVAFDGWAPLDGKSLEECKIKINCKVTFHPKYPTPKGDVVQQETETESVKKKHKEEEEEKREVDSQHKGGILSCFIRQGMDLQIGDLELLADDDLSHPYNPNQVVSPYACLYLNDSKVFQTRSKLRNPSPHWNAVSEHFIRDFDSTTIRISVKNSVELERDPVIGFKVFNLADLFEDKENSPYKEGQAWFVLENGIGFGKVLVTLKYKPVRLTLPRQLQGSKVGTLIVDSIILEKLCGTLSPSRKSVTRATLSLNVDPAIEKHLKAKDQEPDEISWTDKHLFFPLIMRYRSAIYLHVSQGSMGGHKATGRIWLKEIADNEWQDVHVGLHKPLSEHTKEANRNEDAWDVEGENGQAILRVKIMPGFSPVHTHLSSFNMDMVGADPFHNEKMKVKAQEWVRDHGQGDANAEETDESQASTSTVVSDREDSADEYTREMYGLNKNSKVSKYRVLRKVEWGTDLVKQRIDTIREGFNSEARNNRTVNKEV
ncbi:hypothetical protein BJV82DRAFT_563066 [Fennellomyces sp. T-0311]|nr:hypothetical protein BJV82DRAFT_563066 [Fennellomyces sp. T-0311]